MYPSGSTDEGMTRGETACVEAILRCGVVVSPVVVSSRRRRGELMKVAPFGGTAAVVRFVMMLARSELVRRPSYANVRDGVDSLSRWDPDGTGASSLSSSSEVRRTTIVGTSILFVCVFLFVYVYFTTRKIYFPLF